MILKHDTDHGHHNPSTPLLNTSVDCKFVTHEDESIPSEAMKNKDNTDIMDELAAMIQPTNQLRSSIPKSTLHQISKMVMKKAVKNKKIKLMRSGTKIPVNNVDILDLNKTLELYGLINDG